MSVSKYQMFVKTVECGSFSKAAEALNFTQSGVSHAVQSLEDELGVTLLSRNRGGVVLTADGRALLPKIERLCAAHRALMQSAADLKGMDAGLVESGHIFPACPPSGCRLFSRASVSCIPILSSRWSPAILRAERGVDLAGQGGLRLCGCRRPSGCKRTRCTGTSWWW